MFAVIWSDRALDELADAMVRSDLPTQDLIERQVLAINARLASDPLDEGESRWGNFRITFADPVCILFEVNEMDGVVHVVHFWTH